MVRAVPIIAGLVLVVASCNEASDEECPEGDCVLPPPLGWEGPLLLWVGAPGEAPDCPDRARYFVYEGHDGLSLDSVRCPACSCEPAVCELQGLVAHGDAACGSASPAPYQAPAGWDGACVSSGTVADAQLGSILFTALTQAPCAPIQIPVLERGSFGWERVARGCRGDVERNWCWENRDHICVPEAEPWRDEFRQCIFKDELVDICPLGYPARQVFFGGFDDNVTCTPCECTPPEGGACRASVRVYSDAMCSSEMTQQEVDLSPSQCSPPLAGDLQSMSATWLQNEAGSCTPIPSRPAGRPELLDPATFCCIPF